MNIVNDKKSIINEIGVLTSIGKTVEIPNQNFTFPSVNIKNEPIPFMLDLLSACIGSEALQRTTGQLMTDFIRKVEPELKTQLKKQNTLFNSTNQLPSTFSSSGYIVSMKKIDLFSKLKTPPSSSAGSILYQDSVNCFDQVAYTAIIDPNTYKTFGNMEMAYNDVTDMITFKPLNPSETIGSFVNTFIDNIDIINEKEFTTQIMESIYGTVSSTTKKPLNVIVDEEKIRKLIEKLIESDDIASISDAELEEIQRIANNKFKGVVPVDVGCSIIDSVTYLQDIIDLIGNNTGNTNPISVGSGYTKVMDDSFGRVPEQTNPANKNAIKDGYFKRLIKSILNALIMAITSTPQIRALLAMISGFKNNNIINIPSGIEDDINTFRNYIHCIAKSAGALLNEFIFNLLKIELVKLIIPVTKFIVKEKLQSFIRIIQSLI